jgi:hypothetical protein
MFWQGRIWKWGVVAPATALAFAGALADIVTSTVDYWYLLAPSYFVIAISVWNDLGAFAKSRRTALTAAEAAVDDGDEDEEAPRTLKPPSIVEAGDAGLLAAGDDAIVTHVQTVTALSVVGALGRLFIQGLGTFCITLICLVAIWAAIAIGTWGKGYWYIYGPVLAGIAWLTWVVVRSGPANTDGAGATPGERLVR